MNRETIQQCVADNNINCNILYYAEHAPDPNQQFDVGTYEVWYTFDMTKTEADDLTYKTITDDEHDLLFFFDDIEDEDDLINRVIDEILIDKPE